MWVWNTTGTHHTVLCPFFMASVARFYLYETFVGKEEAEVCYTDIASVVSVHTTAA